MNEKKVNNALFVTTIKIGASKPKQFLWYFVNVIFFKNPFNIISSSKTSLLRLFGATIGKGVVIKPCVNIKYPWKLKIGDHSWIGENVWIDNLSDITIGESVTLSQGALLLTGEHDYKKESFDFFSNPIILEDGVWIGTRAIVLGGTTCRSHSILSANSVAKKMMEPYTIYIGNPALPSKTRQMI
ncbi:WcaF family extracellular polysaccharide biosynthesis acetyltransferase [Ferruginibacter albus]|uniref:WcaF family extracellular polysaccharide biosynthesis acetyltransferase n=1 Tax=Ferruginibacter albus TaxID=2875540 RepID=UPI001CC3CDAC|nr:WcaF family extracellular polysaccharide biosynthesis acetyltransferase [Ferruginibacter albus]UAY50669.1 WcaF family extracellular polysaccharide biosynthesis acetyltransferase [Ferruginibacter albus]